MRDAHGRTWLPIAESARRHRVREATIRVWITRNRVRGIWTLGTYFVCDDEVADAELAWQRRAERAS